MIYLLDASVLISAHGLYYPVDRVPEFWEWLLHHAEIGEIKVPIEIFEEVKEGPEDEGRDLLFDWITDADVKEALLLKEEVDPTLVNQVVGEGYAPDLTDSELEQLGRDPFLIAYALADAGSRCVVTAESSKPSKKRQNRRIPDVCKGLKIRSIGTFELVKELDFSTSWHK